MQASKRKSGASNGGSIPYPFSKGFIDLHNENKIFYKDSVMQ